MREPRSTLETWISSFSFAANPTTSFNLRGPLLVDNSQTNLHGRIRPCSTDRICRGFARLPPAIDWAVCVLRRRTISTNSSRRIVDLILVRILAELQLFGLRRIVIESNSGANDPAEL